MENEPEERDATDCLMDDGLMRLADKVSKEEEENQ